MTVLRIDIDEAARLLSEKGDYVILTHANPDGDTLGSAYALMRALRLKGSRAAVLCADKIASKYSYLVSADDDICENARVVAVDVADLKLLGSLKEKYADRVEICIDHHGSNLLYAEKTLLDSEAAAACEIIYGVIKRMGVSMDADIATCLYTGISTDTGCFRYSNVTAETHIIAGELISLGAEHTMVDKLMFETKSRSYFCLEKLCLESMEFYFDDTVAIVYFTQAMLSESGADESCSDAIAALPRQVEGVNIGVTIKEKDESVCKISVRTNEPYSAKDICAYLGGGGHERAAGCQVNGSVAEARKKILEAIKSVYSYTK